MELLPFGPSESWRVLRYLSYDSLSGLVELEEEVVCLDEELAGVLLHLGHPLLPQQPHPGSSAISYFCDYRGMSDQ